MSRTVDEIKKDMERRWMESAALKTLYGWELGSDNKPPEFAAFYSKASLENVLLYIVAFCGYVIERLMDEIRKEIEDEISTKVPGSLLWYVKKMKEFVYMPYLPESERDKVVFDDNSGEYTIDESLSTAALDNAQIIKHAVAIDDNRANYLQIKIATEDSEKNLKPLTPAQKEAFESYFSRIKYAGVRAKIITADGDRFNCSVTVWYDAMYTAADVKRDCEKAVKNYIKGLPFNGEYSNMALIDSLQNVKGVKIAELSSSSYTLNQNGRTQKITAKVRPFAGYFNVGSLNFTMKCYE